MVLGFFYYLLTRTIASCHGLWAFVTYLVEPLLLGRAHREAVADGLERGLTAEQARSTRA